jgi:uncharacterized membrane protein
MMRSRARILGHPIHPVLIVFPLGLLLTATGCDAWGWWRGEPFWRDLAFYLIVAGLIGGLVAAPFGLIDWLAIPKGTRAKAIGAWHGGGNLAVLMLFFLSGILRLGTGPGTAWSFVLALCGSALAMITGWLGGELVVRLGVGVDPGAHVDAPSSLSHQESREVDASVPRARR